jgi:hypothetical protein
MPWMQWKCVRHAPDIWPGSQPQMYADTLIDARGAGKMNGGIAYGAIPPDWSFVEG